MVSALAGVPADRAGAPASAHANRIAMSHLSNLLVDALICPECSGHLAWTPDRLRLDCRTCPLSYPVRDGVPALVIEQASARPTDTTRTTYRDIGVAVYTLLHVPWTVSGFELDRYRRRLYQLHLRMQLEGGFTATSYGFLVEAHT